MVPTLRAGCAVLVLTSGLGREEELNKEHQGRTDQPQMPWVPLPLSPQDEVANWEKDPGDTCSIPAGGWQLTTTQGLQKGLGVSFSIKI